MAEPGPSTGSLRAILREPTVHFVILAGLLFLVNAAVASDEETNVIEIDRRELEARIIEAEASLGVRFTDEARQRAREAYVDEQVLVREARALGLEDDPRVDDLLAQKMLHVLSADVIQPSDGELQAYFDAHRARYTPPPTVTVDELVVGVTGPVPAPLLRQLEQGTPPERLRAGVPLRAGILSDSSLDDLLALFGPETADRVFTAEEGRWVGPHSTVRGQHWFRVTSRTEAIPPRLEAIRERLRLDWVTEQEEVRLERRLDELRERYRIVFVGEDPQG